MSQNATLLNKIFPVHSSIATSQRNIIIRALLTFHRSTCIRFVWRRRHRNYLHFFSGSGYDDRNLLLPGKKVKDIISLLTLPYQPANKRSSSFVHCSGRQKCSSVPEKVHRGFESSNTITLVRQVLVLHWSPETRTGGLSEGSGLLVHRHGAARSSPRSRLPPWTGPLWQRHLYHHSHPEHYARSAVFSLSVL